MASGAFTIGGTRLLIMSRSQRQEFLTTWNSDLITRKACRKLLRLERNPNYDVSIIWTIANDGPGSNQMSISLNYLLLLLILQLNSPPMARLFLPSGTSPIRFIPSIHPHRRLAWLQSSEFLPTWITRLLESHKRETFSGLPCCEPAIMLSHDICPPSLSNRLGCSADFGTSTVCRTVKTPFTRMNWFIIFHSENGRGSELIPFLSSDLNSAEAGLLLGMV
jgi:hypothetical protein